jgi:hypothetical protein
MIRDSGFREDWEICSTLGDVDCRNCGEHGKQPCDTRIPNHIPKLQIPLFIRIAKEKRNESKIL